MSRYNPLDFERWRKLMVGGALILLVTTILRSFGVIGSGVLYAFGLGGGYILLVFGFGAALRQKREQQEPGTKERENDPPPSGS